MSKQLRGSLLLLLAAAVWGLAFVAQRVGMDAMQPLSFNGIRLLLAGICLLPVIAVSDKKKKEAGAPAPDTARKGLQLKAGVLCGLFLFAASALQQAGLVYTSAGKSGFLTALYVVLVPVAGWLIFRKDPGRAVIVSVVLAVIGLYLLCFTDTSFTVNIGDVLLILCALCFTGHILVIDRFSPFVDGIRLSCTQFFIAGSLCVLVSLFTETITLSGIREALIPLLYAGVMSGAVGYTLQIVAQKDTDPTVASLIMCLESVFAVIFGAVVLRETMTGREIAGCAIMFTAVILAQLSPLIGKRGKRG